MRNFILNRGKFISIAILGILVSSISISVYADGESEGNRYFLERYYAGEISAAKAFVDSIVKKGKWTDRSDKLTIVDVRDATEYKLGHPEKAISSPYPRIYRECVDDNRTEDGACANGTVYAIPQSPEALFLDIESKIPDKNARIATLCRTGFRSVLAGNILANPAHYICDVSDTDCIEEYAERGYSRVYNIWQGFVGQPKPGIVTRDANGNRGRWVVGDDQELTDIMLDDGTLTKGFVADDLDLNNDDEITSADKDGWRYHQGLPYDTRMLPQLLNKDINDLGYYDMP